MSAFLLVNIIYLILKFPPFISLIYQRFSASELWILLKINGPTVIPNIFRISLVLELEIKLKFLFVGVMGLLLNEFCLDYLFSIFFLPKFIFHFYTSLLLKYIGLVESVDCPLLLFVLAISMTRERQLSDSNSGVNSGSVYAWFLFVI